MKIAISNLAWEKSENEQVLQLLQKCAIKGIEVSISKVGEDLKSYRNWWNKNNIGIVATTSLLFGHPELTLFENAETRSKTFEFLCKRIEESHILGAKALVFGSPKNRNTNGLARDEIYKIAGDFFYKIGEIAKQYGVYFGIEPNPPLYGTDFINTTAEAVELVKQVNHPNFSLHLDTSTMTINHENYLETIKMALPYAHHYHISEPGLKPIPSGETEHKAVAEALKKSGYKNWVSLEMPLSPGIDHLPQIKSSLELVNTFY